MPTPHPPRPHHPPGEGDPGESDEILAARLRDLPESEAARSAALLMARHWQSAHDYAAICLASSAHVTAMVTAAAWHRVLDRLAQGEPATALRPRLLVAVRDTVRQWSADDRTSGALPELLKPAGGRGMRAAKSLTPENRTLAARSFASLPGPARCLLWHTEVEGEPIDVPAGLLGMDTDTATVTLEQAREKFREGCVHAHRQLAPTQDCRFHNRLLDVPIRRGGTLLPDVRRHLADCRHCRHAAEQLGHFERGLGTLIAEAVLGWGARRYLDSRPGRRAPGARGHGVARHRGGRPGLLARIPVPVRRAPAGPRSPRSVLRGVGAASAGVLAIVLVVSVWSYDGGGADPAASTSAVDGRGTASGTSRPKPPGTADLPPASDRTRLRNVAAGLCLDVRGEPKAGAGARLERCSRAWTQQWTYEDDGLLRSVADPGLCLDSRADAGVVVLGTCADAGTGRGDDVRYDLTAQGALLPRWQKQLALAATTGDPGADVVVKVHDGSTGQRWRTEPAPAAEAALSRAGTDTPHPRPAQPSPARA
ncbi:ricin-type beta-trefoil lectin domain protein [Streptomyces sp. TRM S81-3]|uniref:Ricin-type beta-trefoil lectin domain protein n=1 Tax=Streptomyces griseicoloratus TaxID=2752516 RepID=A0A926QQA7_9ACTN|nr:RICIN domain-containing protein [Streptomyces griseicoloratus]MBD0420173.1 ricin-type beta-trefoil lectin domain protein [Streptomyces griseicoloratus]